MKLIISILVCLFASAAMADLDQLIEYYKQKQESQNSENSSTDQTTTPTVIVTPNTQEGGVAHPGAAHEAYQANHKNSFNRGTRYKNHNEERR